MKSELKQRSWIGEIFNAEWRSKRVWLLHVISNSVLLLLAYLFLVVPDRTRLQVMTSGLLATVLLCAGLWLHGATFMYFSEMHASGQARFRTAVRDMSRRLPPAIVWLLAVTVILLLVAKLEPWLYSISGLMRAKLPFIRSMFSVQTTDSIVAAKYLVLWAVIVPVIFLPLFAAIARYGVAGWGSRGWRAVGRSLKNWRWWVAYVVLFCVGAYVPWRLAYWVPEVDTLGGEFASMIVRLKFAYLLAVTAWILVISAVTWFSRDTEVVPERRLQEVRAS